mgnify:FL=1
MLFRSQRLKEGQPFDPLYDIADMGKISYDCVDMHNVSPDEEKMRNNNLISSLIRLYCQSL